MREILFRGKRIDNGEWVEGDLVWLIDGNKKTPYLCGEGEIIPEIIPESISEFAGVNDKNGKKIFEGDILRFDYTGQNLGVSGTAAVVFANGKFCVEWGWHKEFVCLDGFANTTIEVIGNIHDNELEARNDR